MAGNFGRFIDRSPIICAAGKSTGIPKETVGSTLREYSLEDRITAIKHDAKIWTEPEDIFVVPRELPPIRNFAFQGTQTQIRPLINPPVKTRFQEMINDLKETTYDSYWNKQDGKDPYNPDKQFGSKTPYDPRGVWVRCACDWHKKEPVIHSSKIQANYFDRVKSEIGKSLTPHHNIECVPKGHSFGRPAGRPLFDLEELLKDPNCPPCIFKRDFYKWMASFNRFRFKMKERSNKDFNYDDFYKRALYWDKQETGYLPIEVFYDLCACEHITYQKEDIESLLKILQIIVDDKINYKKFIDIINVNKPPITMMPFNDVPKHAQYYLTTNQAASCDYLIINNTGMPAAGTPSIRHDLPRPIVPPDGCRADLVHLGADTSANALLSPIGNMNKSAKTIRTLFKKVGYNFPGDTFQKLWKEGLERDQTGCVCVDTFKTLMKTHCPPPKLAVDEQECEKLI
ncbi:hypothetical protein NQ314_016817 [Rhamnusium bicolor]|uniref:EFHB C-terminal EF-hand domain-containing protein n=1 Tax=Rhamnusium bicolor TaxID=1586634 RepID=A0AAV8WVW0_9CUCU|nr:hypothetical protein NQ314_016817 [Rhamnusium bicolor]